MSDVLGIVLKKIFGSASQRYVKSNQHFVQSVADLEPVYEKLTNEELRAKTDEFKRRIEAKKIQVFHDRPLSAMLAELQEVPEERRKGLKKEIIAGLSECAAEVLHEAFAAVREAGKRILHMRHFNVQMIGGKVLHEGKIAEMATGEGKTLVATLPCYMNALLGLKVHVVSVNDYLVKRDRDWMAPIYESLGLSVGAIQSNMETIGEDRRKQYECDITYGTNNELGFDYLRDNMKTRKIDQVQGPLHYATPERRSSFPVRPATTSIVTNWPTAWPKRSSANSSRQFAIRRHFCVIPVISKFSRKKRSKSAYLKAEWKKRRKNSRRTRSGLRKMKPPPSATHFITSSNVTARALT
jgi:preprotein translocase subunit SecA